MEYLLVNIDSIAKPIVESDPLFASVSIVYTKVLSRFIVAEPSCTHKSAAAKRIRLSSHGRVRKTHFQRQQRGMAYQPA